MTHPPLPLDDLEAKARAATPGPYHHDKEVRSSVFEHVFAGVPDGPGQTVAQWVLPQDAAYIAAANPRTVLALIKRVRELEEGLNATINLAERLRLPYSKEELERLRALLAKEKP